MSESSQQKYLRFPLVNRIEHLVLLTSFTVLGFTGLVQKFALNEVSQFLIGLLGGIEVVRIIHRVAAIALMLETVFHIGMAGYHIFVLRSRPVMLPALADIRAGIQAFLYNLRLGKKRPQEGRYTFGEKFEYWAVVWGTIVMAITGFVLWNPIATTRLFPGEFIPAAKEVHGGEALLAVISIIIWHMYHVHIRSFNRSMFTGYMGEKEMLEEHPLELADIKAGIAKRPPNPKAVSRRQRVYLPLYAILAALLLVGIYLFASFEETAIATVPNPEQVVVYAPLTPTPFPTLPPTQTPQPTPEGGSGGGAAAASWDGGIGTLFQQKCSTCHGSAAQLGGLNLSSYASALAGGATGSGLVPGDPEASQIVIIQSAGGHPGQLTPEELEQVRQWIAAGAPE